MNRKRIAELKKKTEHQERLNLGSEEVADLVDGWEEAQTLLADKVSGDRCARIIQWTAEGIPAKTTDPAGETEIWPDEVWWGFWRQVGGEDVRMPDAMFPTESQALAFARVVDLPYDWHVGPVVVTITARDNYCVPEESDD